MIITCCSILTLGEKVQSLYSSLEVKDSEIYCQRAKKLYSSPEATKTGLFMFTMEHTKLLAMFDTSMLGEEKLVRNLKEIDSIRCVDLVHCIVILISTLLVRIQIVECTVEGGWTNRKASCTELSHSFGTWTLNSAY